MNHTRTLSLISLSVLFSTSCGAEGGNVEIGGLPGTLLPPPSEAAGGAGAQPASGGVANLGPGDGDLIPFDEGQGVEPGDGDMMTCGGESFGAEPKTLEMYVLFDDSGSWGFQAWETVTEAVKGFITDEASNGIGVALRFFGSECSADPFLTPEVGMDVLPNHREELQMALDARTMSGETVTQPALTGGIQYANDRLATGVNSRIVMLLVTDGEPDESDCFGVADMPNDIPAVATTAATGTEGDTPIPTYVLAVAGGVELTERLHSIAMAGGTEQAINADPASLVAAFEAIRNQELASLPCEYDLPEAYDKLNDPDLVNLTLGAVPLGKVEAEADCVAGTGGWFYDDPAAPTRIIACGSTCDELRAAPQGTTVDIALGCPTIDQPK